MCNELQLHAGAGAGALGDRVEQLRGATASPAYQTGLVAAAREQDGAAALSVSDVSLDNATQRIEALLAAQRDGERAGASD